MTSACQPTYKGQEFSFCRFTSTTSTPSPIVQPSSRTFTLLKPNFKNPFGAMAGSTVSRNLLPSFVLSNDPSCCAYSFSCKQAHARRLNQAAPLSQTCWSTGTFCSRGCAFWCRIVHTCTHEISGSEIVDIDLPSPRPF